uniref:Uncharacterized protein n=1 Tax=Parascaris univalens TaxID=6257 RepID=A0A915BI34_PARUN
MSNNKNQLSVGLHYVVETGVFKCEHIVYTIDASQHVINSNPVLKIVTVLQRCFVMISPDMEGRKFCGDLSGVERFFSGINITTFHTLRISLFDDTQ